MLSTEINYWPRVINILLHSYFSELTTTCVLWHKDYDVICPSVVNFNVYLHINLLNVKESFAKDVYNYTQQDAHHSANGIYYNDFVRKYVAAIQHTNCEGFLVFQDDIPKFVEIFRNASKYSKWRSARSRFLFVYTKANQTEDYFQDVFFRNFVNILIVETDFWNSTQFSLKTNKFVGSIDQQPQELIYVASFDALNGRFEPERNLYSTDKLQDLQGREIIVGAFDYRPFVVVDYKHMPQYRDHAVDNPRHLVHIEGTELHIVHVFCELYNCTVEVDTSEKAEWGFIYANFTGDGLMGMVLEGKTHISMGAMYRWDTVYAAVDHTNFLGRSGVTCLVPAPTRLTSWTLPVKPFRFTLWLGVLGCLMLETLSLFVARRVEMTLVERLEHVTWWSCLQFGYITTLKLFISQSSSYVVNSHTVRTVLFACYMIDIILTNIYGGGLSSILTLPSLGEAADSLERLYRHNLSWTASSYVWVASIAEREDGEVDPVFDRIFRNFHIRTKDKMRSMAKTENMGFAVERLAFGNFGNADFLTPTSLDRLKLMIDDIYDQLTIAIVPRLWPHLPKYDDLILNWHSSGLSKFWEWKITAEYLNVNQQYQVQASRYTHYDTGPVKLGMSNFAGLILLWCVGIGVSIVIFLGELLVYWVARKMEGRQRAQMVDNRRKWA